MLYQIVKPVAKRLVMAVYFNIIKFLQKASFLWHQVGWFEHQSFEAVSIITSQPPLTQQQ